MRWRATWSTRWVTDMAAHVPKVHVVIRALDRNQDARLKRMAETALESGMLTVETPTDV